MNKCCHNSISINDLFTVSSPYYYLNLAKILLGVTDSTLASIGIDCTEECKQKMLQITQIVFDQCKNDRCWYYHDTKSGVDESSPWDYSNIMKLYPERKTEASQYYNFTTQLDENGNFPPYSIKILKIKKR